MRHQQPRDVLVPLADAFHAGRHIEARLAHAVDRHTLLITCLMTGAQVELFQAFAA